MLRSFFLAAGINLCVLGCLCLFIDQALLTSEPSGSLLKAAKGILTAAPRPAFHAQEWMPWIFTAVGVITMIYTFTLPKRMGFAG